jgi:hypothetical protein
LLGWLNHESEMSNVACMMRYVYKIFAENLEWTHHLKDLYADGMIILKWILYWMWVLTELRWLKIWSNDRVRWTCWRIFTFSKNQDFHWLGDY